MTELSDKLTSQNSTPESCGISPAAFLRAHQQALVFIGIQASGKTTFFQQFCAKSHAHINLDTAHTRHQEQLAIQAALMKGQSFAADNTNLTRADRTKYIQTAKAAGYQVIGLFFQSVLKDCIQRNALRENAGKIPAHALAASSNRLELPDFSEGFDELYFVSIRANMYHITHWRTI